LEIFKAREVVRNERNFNPNTSGLRKENTVTKNATFNRNE